jgi:hypothetical protein
MRVFSKCFSKKTQGSSLWMTKRWKPGKKLLAHGKSCDRLRPIQNDCVSVQRFHGYRSARGRRLGRGGFASWASFF